MSNSDSDLPDLVDSSDEDTPWLTTADHAEKWLKKTNNFLKEQEQWNRLFCLGPFLFGVDDIISPAWIEALLEAKLILNLERKKQITYFGWPEWECLDLVDHAVGVVHENLRNKETLSKLIDLVQRLDSCRSDIAIDVDLAIKEAGKVSQISHIWNVILKNQLSKGKEKAAKFAVLYIVRIYREHVLSLVESGCYFVDNTKKRVATREDILEAEEFKITGNELFCRKDYRQSEMCYTQAARKDPFCHIYYSNRAQAYHKLERYIDALADGRRAITIKPDFAKGHFRYAKAFRLLGQLDSAIKVIKNGLDLCRPVLKTDSDNVKQLEELQTQYTAEKQGKLLSPIPKDLNEKLLSMPMEDGELDLSDKLDIRVPPHKKFTGDLSIFNDPEEFPNRESNKENSNSTNTALEEKDKKKIKKRKEEDMKKKKQTEEEKSTEKGEIARESNHSQTLNLVKKKQEEEKREFDSYLHDGWEALKCDTPKAAMLNYRKALDLIISAEKMKLYGIDDIDLVTLKYAFGISAVQTGLLKHILEGVENFQDIIDNHQDVRFPLAYFGLGKAYVALYRFSDALEPLQAGRTIARNITYLQVTWPGTNNKIPENESSELLRQIKELIQLCKSPPAPEALCRHHPDSDTQTAIYYNDPAFKGCIKIICQVNCVIPFHLTCWKTYKEGLKKSADKEVLDTQCPTPDCAGFIVKLAIIRHDGIPKEYCSTKHSSLKETKQTKKPSAKQRSTNETKLVKKQEKKEIRKQKKKQRQDENLDLIENNSSEDGVVITDGASASAFIEEMHSETEPKPLPALKDTTVLKKEELDLQKNNLVTGKNRRGRRKKEKSKQILNVEVSFSDRREENLLNENSVVSDEEVPKSKAQTPFSVPAELKSQIQTFEQNYQGNAKPLFQPDEITENLFSYFGDILQANGPLAVDDVKIQQELEVFPPEALDKIKQVGGLCDFLKQSLKFAVIDDVISLLCDAKRAREIALLRRSQRESKSAPVIVPVNAWTTVGKSTNNIDSLKQSTLIKSSVGFPQVSVPKTSMQSNSLGIINSSSSSSLVSVGSDSTNLSETNKPVPHESITPSVSSETKSDVKSQSGVNNLDSIDDFPALIPSVSKREAEVTNDFDDISDPESDTGKPYVKVEPKKESLGDKLELTLSRSSSHSDLSEKSSRSGLTSDLRPKPLRPLGVEKIGLGRKFSPLTTNWDKLESDFDSSWNKVKKEEFEGMSDSVRFGRVGLELKQATEDFVRKSDEKFVSELAESVVEKLYHGKIVSETERQNTLNKVSSDIWKDFEKSANSGKERGAGLWANTPAGQDYSNNLGKFASDFMKQHYEKTDNSTISPTSTLTSPFTPVTCSVENILPLPNSSISSSTWSSCDSGSKSTSASPFSISSTGYNLFSGPTWGIDAFNSNTPTSPIVNSVIRPPSSASAYYQKTTAPPSTTPGLFHPPEFPGFAPPSVPHVRMPPPFTSPYQAPRTEKKDANIQITPLTKTVGAMTDRYEPYKDECDKMKEDMNEFVKLLNESQVAYNKMLQDSEKKDRTIKEYEAKLADKENVFDYERKNWTNERKSFSEKIRELQHQLENKDKVEKELEDRVIGYEQKVKELAASASDQRTKDVAEISRLKERMEKYQKEVETQAKRAVSAEVELLKTKLNTTKGFLERSQKEASYHNQHLSAQISKLKEESKTVPPALLQTVDYWKKVVHKSEENLTKLVTDADVQMSEIKNGKQYSELNPLSVDSPPQMPETVKAYMIGAAGQMMFQRSQQHQRPASKGFGAATGNGQITATQTPASLPSTAPGLQPTPKPLTPINPSSSLIPPRPLSSLRSSAAKPAPIRPLGTQQAPLSSFGKLMVKLSTTFPSHSKQELTVLIQELRQEKGGSLSGMTMEDIINKIGEKIGKPRTASPQNQMTSQRTLAPPPGINKSWAFTASGLGNVRGSVPHKQEMFQEEEDPCVICHEEMTSQPSVTLECNHTFHDECIRKWFQEQSTCPNCRVHTLLSDEFPSLHG